MVLCALLRRSTSINFGFKYCQRASLVSIKDFFSTEKLVGKLKSDDLSTRNFDENEYFTLNSSSDVKDKGDLVSGIPKFFDTANYFNVDSVWTGTCFDPSVIIIWAIYTTLCRVLAFKLANVNLKGIAEYLGSQSCIILSGKINELQRLKFNNNKVPIMSINMQAVCFLLISPIFIFVFSVFSSTPPTSCFLKEMTTDNIEFSNFQEKDDFSEGLKPTETLFDKIPFFKPEYLSQKQCGLLLLVTYFSVMFMNKRFLNNSLILYIPIIVPSWIACYFFIKGSLILYILSTSVIYATVRILLSKTGMLKKIGISDYFEIFKGGFLKTWHYLKYKYPAEDKFFEKVKKVYKL